MKTLISILLFLNLIATSSISYFAFSLRGSVIRAEQSINDMSRSIINIKNNIIGTTESVQQIVKETSINVNDFLTLRNNYMRTKTGLNERKNQ